MNSTIKIHDPTRKKLKLLAAMLDLSMINVLDILVEKGMQEMLTAPAALEEAARVIRLSGTEE